MKRSKAFILLTCCVLSTRIHAATVTVSTNLISEAPFLGYGVQWSPYPWFDITDEAWDRVFEHLDFMRVPAVRVMTRAYKYCDGLDADGNPVYDWDNNRMQKMRRLLDYCQQRNVTVIIGEWDDPSSPEDRADKASDKLQQYNIGVTDPRWTRMIGDFLDQMIKSNGYTCIRYYNLINEPNGDWSNCANFDNWAVAIRNLHGELKERGLDQAVKITGPDASQVRDYWWIDRTVIELSEIVAAYLVHDYISPANLEAGYAQKVLTQKREFIDRFDWRGGRKKPFFMGEIGMSGRGPVEPQGGLDSHPKIYDYIYGVWMADYNVQSARAGQQGTIAWMLDDAMHINKDVDNPDKSTNWPDVRTTLFKKWGFFNSLADEIGHPEDADLRPWFYTWSLFSRLFPRDSQILDASGPDIAGIRFMAARLPDAATPGYSFALVNNSDEARDLNIQVPFMNGTWTLHRYHYFENDRPVDSRGYPVPASQIDGVDLASGFAVLLPARSVIFYTTMK